MMGLGFGNRPLGLDTRFVLLFGVVEENRRPAFVALCCTFFVSHGICLIKGLAWQLMHYMKRWNTRRPALDRDPTRREEFGVIRCLGFT